MAHTVTLLLAAFTIATVGRAQSLVLTTGLPEYYFGAGDLDGDGVADVGYYAQPLQQTLMFRSGLNGAPLPWLSRPGMGLGWAGQFAPVGDANGDGYDDFAYFVQGLQPNFVEVVSGADGASLWTWSVTNPLVYGMPGLAVDVDGDGCDEITFTHEVAGVRVAEVRSGRTGGVLLTVSNAWIVPVGDTNGDGYGDVAVMTGASTYTALLRLGPSLAPGATFGDRCWPVGDTNGNGTSDLFGEYVVASSAIFDGNGGVLWWTGMAALRATGCGDVDGDGCDDVLLVDPPPLGGPDWLQSGATDVQLPGPQPDGVIHPLGDVDGDGRCELGDRDAQFQPALLQWVDAAQPLVSRMVRRGAGGTTSQGHRPRVHTRGSCRIGHTAWFDLRGGQPAGFTFLLFGDPVDVDMAPFGAPGSRAYVDHIWEALLATDGHGVAVHSLAVPNSVALLGGTLSVQAAVVDPAANALGLVGANAVDLTVAN